MRRETLKRSLKADLVIAAAAVSDWRFAAPSRHKIKRKPGAVTLKLLPNPDIIKDAARRRRPGQVFVGFALETRDVVASGRRKLAAKKLDLVVANAASTLGAAGSVFHLVSKNDVSTVRGSKAAAAKAILRSAHEKRAA
jgi:phosphopantothenoylcysteine decarboxylase/phosphopantothenate--cysteine ligase